MKSFYDIQRWSDNATLLYRTRASKGRVRPQTSAADCCTEAELDTWP